MIGRRGMLGGMMSWWAAGNARQPLGPQSREANRPDRKPLGITRAGTGPAPQQGTFVGRLVIISGSGINVGLFTYVPSAGAGNLTATIAAQAGTDPYGNAYLSGNVTYTGGSPVYAWQQTGATINFYTATTQAGPWTLVWQIATDTANSNAFALATVPLELRDRAVPAAATGIGAGPLVFGNASGQLGYVSDALNGDSNTYDTGRLILISPGVTINSNVTPVNVFNHHLGVGKYYVRAWMVVANTTAADAASWGFAGSGGLVATGPLDFTSKTSGTATVGYGASGSFTTTFNNQGVAGSQGIEMQATLTVTTAGTFNLQGLELVAGNTVTVAAGAVLHIYPVVAT